MYYIFYNLVFNFFYFYDKLIYDLRHLFHREENFIMCTNEKGLKLDIVNANTHKIHKKPYEIEFNIMSMLVKNIIIFDNDFNHYP